MALDMDKVFSELNKATQSIEDDIANHANTMDSSNTQDTMELQQMMQKWTIATQMQSNTLKTISEGIKSTVANIR